MGPSARLRLAQDDGDGIGLLHFSVILSGVPQARSRRIRFLLVICTEFLREALEPPVAGLRNMEHAMMHAPCFFAVSTGFPWFRGYFIPQWG